MLRELLAAIGLSLLLSLTTQVSAQSKAAPALPNLEMNPGESVLYDARSIGFDRNGSGYLFDGDVVLIGGGYLITADKVSVDNIKKELNATGHVLFINEHKIFTGESVRLQWENGEFTIRNAVLVANDPQEIQKVASRVLGQSLEEIQYESARKLRLEELAKAKADLLDKFRKLPLAEPDPALVESYAALIEQEKLVAASPSPSQAERDPERRERFERRRLFWEKSRSSVPAAVEASYYARIEGESLERRDGFLYRAKDASFTPCICDENETPAWSLQADTIEMMQEGYVDFKHPILRIKGLPVLYLPFMKLPFKNKRQSGFLMPSIQTDATKNGFVYTQPLFLDLAPNADATVTTDLIQKRGTRVGVETRYEARRFSGFRYKAEIIRDRSWLESTSQRADLSRYFLSDSPFCAGDPDPISRQVCEQAVKENLTPPANTQRGQQEWEGRYFLAPRLSMVSNGTIVSDHRYVEDLYLPENIVKAFASQANATKFSTAKARVNFDGEQVFAALGSSYGDDVYRLERYEGQQMPLSFSMQSRYFRLLPPHLIALPIYAELQARAIMIDELHPHEDPLAVRDVSLGSGSWQRYALQLTTPLASESIVRVDHFADAEVRSIEHKGLNEASSTIRSWRTGLTLNLPISGTGQLPHFFRSAESEGEAYVRHLMDWSLSVSLRPVVVRDGPYGDLRAAQGAPLVYFPSDRKVIYSDDKDVPDEDIMVRHQRITLSTNQRWQIFDRVWQTVPAKPKASETMAGALEDLKEEARRELMAIKERRAKSPQDMFKESKTGQVEWYVPRFRSVDQNTVEPLWLGVSISYDHWQQKLRQKQVALNERYEQEAQATTDAAAAGAIRANKVEYFDLPESWLGPYASAGVNWMGFSLSTNLTYNLYQKTSSSLSFALGLPAFYSTRLGMGYSVEKRPERDVESQSFIFKRTKLLTTGLNTTIIPTMSVGANLIRKQVENDQVQYGTSYQASYDDDSQCWGLQLVREKDLNRDEREANYYLRLVVIFAGQRRGADVSPGMERYLGRNSETN